LFQAISLRDFIKKINNQDINFNSYQPFKFFYQEIVRPMLTKNLKVSFLVFKKNLKLFLWRKKNNIKFPSFFLNNKSSDLMIENVKKFTNNTSNFLSLEIEIFDNFD